MKYILILIFVIFGTFSVKSQDHKYISPYNELLKGDTLYTFNEKNTMYKTASLRSIILNILPSNTIVTIAQTIEADYETPYDSEKFIAVRIKGQIGFLQMKDLAVAKVEIIGTSRSMLFQYHLDSNLNFALKYREFYEKQIVHETNLELSTASFSVFMYYPKGLDSLTGILVLDHHAEACGYDGGQTYYYYDPEKLDLMAHLYTVGDAGFYYIVEKFIFPENEGGLERTVIFESEEFNMLDEESEWEEITKERRVYTWLNGRLNPEFGRKDD